jgi:hypothetical protein
LYLVFYELGLQFLRDGGYLGYVSSNSFLKNKSGKLLAQHLIDNKLIQELIDFKAYQVFEDISTYACICLISKTPHNKYKYREPDPTKLDQQKLITNINPDNFKTSWKDFDNAHSDNISISPEDTLIIKKLEEAGPKLIDIVDIKVGLATLADSVFTVGPVLEQCENYVTFDKEGTPISIEKSILKRCIKVSKLKNESQLNNTISYIIFPYKQVNGKAVLLTETELSEQFPKTYAYLDTQRAILDKRDKGKANRPYSWYEYGRTQGLNSLWGQKLLVAPLTIQPTFVYCGIEQTLYLSGYAILNKPNQPYDLQLLKIILESAIMKLYIDKRSKKMRSGWNVYSKEFIKNFSIPHLTPEDEQALKTLIGNDLTTFLFNKYDLP